VKRRPPPQGGLPPEIIAALPPVISPGGPWGTPPPYRPPTAAQAAALEAVYARLAEDLAAAGDSCRACGRCCRFKPDGIVLFASSLEMAHLVSRAGPPRPGTFIPSAPATGAWCCPYQEGNLCTARDSRTLGCRTHFCEEPGRSVGKGLHSDALYAIRRIALTEGGTWWYGPARVCLAAWADGWAAADAPRRP